MFSFKIYHASYSVLYVEIVYEFKVTFFSNYATTIKGTCRHKEETIHNTDFRIRENYVLKICVTYV